MTSIANKRVLVDWDGDGFMNNGGVSQDMPPNLFPSQLYANETNLYGIDALEEHSYTDITDPTDLGFITRRIRLGDVADSVIFGWSGYNKYQPHASDPENLLVSSLFGGIADIEVSGGAAEKLPLGAYNETNDLVGVVGAGVPTPYVIGADIYTGATHNRYVSAGYYDFPTNHYSMSVDGTTAIDWSNGIPVLPNTSYTLVLKLTALSGASFTPGYVNVYCNSAVTTTPNFGREWLAHSYSGTLVYAPDFYTHVLTFTTPATADHIMIDGSFGGIVAGTMLLPGTHTAPDRVWDSQITNTAGQFSVVAEANSAYSLSFWVKSADITSIVPTLHVTELGTNTVSDTVLTAVAVGSDWTRVDVSIPTQTYQRGAWVTIDAFVGANPVSPTYTGDLDFTGFMVVAGSVFYPYHAGSLYGYDDITDYVMNATTQSGAEMFTDGMPSEGIANLLLNNDSKMFSPSNVNSPLYGALAQNLLVRIQVELAGVWTDIWTGWTYQFDITPGRTTTREATLIAQQGVFRLANGKFSAPVREDTTMDALVRDLIEFSGWRTTATPFQAAVGLNTRVDENAYMLDTELLYNVVEPGVNTLDLGGQDWGRDTEIRAAIAEVLQSENAVMYLERNGALSVYNRDHWVSQDAPTAVVLDMDAQAATYRYGQDIINRVEVTINRKKLTTDATVWATTRAVRLSAGQEWVAEINPTYTEGRGRTVTEYNEASSALTVYVTDPGAYGTGGEAADTDTTDSVVLEIITDAGNRAYVRVTNNNNKAVWVDVEVKGTYAEVGNTETVTVENGDAIELVQGVHKEAFTTSVLSAPQQAASMGEFHLLRSAYPVGEFESFTVVIQDAATLAFMSAVKIGSMLSVSEIQTGEQDRVHVVIGEEFSFDNSEVFTVTYKLAQFNTGNYGVADVSTVEDETVNLIADMTNAVQIYAGSVTVEPYGLDGLDEVLTWRTGEGQKTALYLDPARDQIRVWRTVRDYNLWPELNSAGNPTDQPILEAEPNVTTIASFINSGVPYGQPISKLVQAADYVSTKNVVHFGFTPYNKQYTVAGSQYTAGAGRIAVVPGAQYRAVIHHTNGVAGEEIQAYWGGNGTNRYVLQPVGSTVNLEDGVRRVDGTFVAVPYAPVYSEQTVCGLTLGDNSGVLTWSMYLVNTALIQETGFRNTRLDPAKAYKYTVFAYLGYGGTSESYTLTVTKDDNTTLDTDTQTLVPGTIVKFEADIPTGCDFVTGRLERTVLSKLDQNIRIYGFSITEAAVTSHLELYEQQDHTLVYV